MGYLPSVNACQHSNAFFDSLAPEPTPALVDAANRLRRTSVVTGRPRFASAALDPSVHDLARFDSGEPALDAWLRDHATGAARSRVAQTSVWLAEGGKEVVGYYALSAHAVPRAESTNRIGRAVPDPVPAALLASSRSTFSPSGAWATPKPPCTC